MTLETIAEDPEEGTIVLQARMQDSDAYVNVELSKEYYEAASKIIEAKRNGDPFDIKSQQVQGKEAEFVEGIMKGDLDDATIHVTVPYRGGENRDKAIEELRETCHKLQLASFNGVPRRKEFNEEEAIGDEEGFVEHVYTAELRNLSGYAFPGILKDIEDVSGGER